MIMLTRISGTSFVLNCDLIERIDSTPDTVVSLVDGKKYVVRDSPAEVVVAIRQHRSEIIALSNFMQVEDFEAPAPRPVPSHVALIHREG